VATIKRLARFLPTPPPQNIPIELQEWLREEFEHLALASNGALDIVDGLKSIPRMFLLGDADDFTLDTTDSTIVNYDDGGALGEVPIEPDLVTGEITIPTTGAYTVTLFIIGVQGNQVQNQSIVLSLGIDAVLVPVASIDVATNQTSIRSLSATLTRGFPKDSIITMSMFATGDLGLFAVSQASLELTLIALPEELQSSEVFNDSINFVPWIVTPTFPMPPP
jgi:hypothetical protein